MKKLLSRALAIVLTSAILFTNTGYSILAASFDADVTNEITNDTETTLNSDEDSDNKEVKTPDDDSVNDEKDNTDTEPNPDVTIVDESDSDKNLSTKDSAKASLTSDTQPEVIQDTNASDNEVANHTWNEIAFGQSTDLNFESTLLPEKIGTQYAKEIQIPVKDFTNQAAQPEMKDAVVIESRGGKIANAHDGLTYYYTELPTSKNFVLEAKVFINQLGPENGSTPSKQEAVGVMARDVIGAPRQDPMVDGYEELPAASNIASTMVIANEKLHNTALNISSYQRNGVFYPYGNAHISYSATKFTSINNDKSKKVTDDVTPIEGADYDSNDFFTLRLERTDSGFITTYIDATGAVIKKGSINDADRLAVIDEETMYVGFFASRNAKATFTDMYLTTTEANTEPCTFVPDSYPLSFTNLSNTTTSSSEYTVALRSNFDGQVKITQDGTVVEAQGQVSAGSIYEFQTVLNQDTTAFSINFESANGSKNETFTVTKNETLKKDLYAAVDGMSDATGDIDAPLDIETAIKYVSEGNTIYVRGGDYGPLDLASTVSGSSNGQKTLSAYEHEAVVFHGNSYVKASYWTIRQIAVTDSDSAGLRASGNNNTFEYCSFYKNDDTGFQLGMGSDTDPLIWPENNTIRFCESFENVDVSGINADGFAAKLGVGTGNLFDSCVSYSNADDGWDLFNKLGDAKNEPVTIQNCIAYLNGANGFKLGGEGYAVDHIVTNSLAFSNLLDGFTDNFNTGVLTVTNCTSVDNARYNYIFRLNPYKPESEQGTFTNNISFKSNFNEETVADYVSGNKVNSYFFGSQNDTITAADFLSITAPDSYQRNEDGTINFGDYMRPTTSSFLARGGVGSSTYLGAIAPQTSLPEILVTDITLSHSKAALKIKESLLVKTTILPEDAANKVLNWTSSNPTIATVDSNGLIKAVSPGSAIITAVSSDGSNISKTVTVTVAPDTIVVTSIKMNKTSLVLAKGKSGKLTASVLPKNATNSSIIWSSSDSKVASVDSTGTVKGNSYGTATIKATSKDNAKVIATSKVTVGYKLTYKLNKGANSAKNPSVYYKQKITLAKPARKGYAFKGWYTDSKLKNKITVIKKGSAKNYTLYAKWEKIKKPSAPTIKNIKNSKSKSFKITLKSVVASAKGYEITYATNKKFTKNKETANISKASTLTKTVSKLGKGKTYYVKVRAYKKDSAGKKVYSKYSKVIKVKIKK